MKYSIVFGGGCVAGLAAGMTVNVNEYSMLWRREIELAANTEEIVSHAVSSTDNGDSGLKGNDFDDYDAMILRPRTTPCMNERTPSPQKKLSKPQSPNKTPRSQSPADSDSSGGSKSGSYFSAYSSNPSSSRSEKSSHSQNFGWGKGDPGRDSPRSQESGRGGRGQNEGRGRYGSPRLGSGRGGYRAGEREYGRATGFRGRGSPSQGGGSGYFGSPPLWGHMPWPPPTPWIGYHDMSTRGGPSARGGSNQSRRQHNDPLVPISYPRLAERLGLGNLSIHNGKTLAENLTTSPKPTGSAAAPSSAPSANLSKYGSLNLPSSLREEGARPTSQNDSQPAASHVTKNPATLRMQTSGANGLFRSRFGTDAWQTRWSRQERPVSKDPDYEHVQHDRAVHGIVHAVAQQPDAQASMSTSGRKAIFTNITKGPGARATIVSKAKGQRTESFKHTSTTPGELVLWSENEHPDASTIHHSAVLHGTGFIRSSAFNVEPPPRFKENNRYGQQSDSS